MNFFPLCRVNRGNCLHSRDALFNYEPLYARETFGKFLRTVCIEDVDYFVDSQTKWIVVARYILSFILSIVSWILSIQLFQWLYIEYTSLRVKPNEYLLIPLVVPIAMSKLSPDILQETRKMLETALTTRPFSRSASTQLCITRR